MFNKVFLLGNLGRDPEARSLPSGTKVTQFHLATHRLWTDSEGNRRKSKDWHYVVCFQRQAEIAAQYLVEGSQVFVEGRIQTRSWEDPETSETRYRTEVVALSLQLLGRGAGTQRDEELVLDSERKD